MLLPLLLACSRPHPTILLVTLDTTRADAIGAYGGPPTPRLDALAAGGVRFELALTHAPTTASAHASIFTGLDPHGHGVPRNGFALDTGLDTVAERLFRAGYDTIAVLGSSALGPKLGFEQGFATFDTHFGVDQRKRFEDTADAVVARALARVDARDAERPLFLWVHFFDAHAPYGPHPDPYTPTLTMGVGEGRSPLVRAAIAGTAPPEDIAYYRRQYQAEVAFVDQQLGVLLDGLAARGLLEGAVVVVAGDHGEMLFEDPLHPVGHGPDVDLLVSRVPLLIGGSGRTGVVEAPVALSDLGPTLLGLAGLEPALGEGRDLGPAMRGRALAPRPIFLEATRPARDEGGAWNNLRAERGVAMDGKLLIVSVRGQPQLYALDPAQPPLAVDEELAPLLRLLTDFDAKAPPGRAPLADAAVQEGLEALGYVE